MGGDDGSNKLGGVTSAQFLHIYRIVMNYHKCTLCLNVTSSFGIESEQFSHIIHEHCRWWKMCIESIFANEVNEICVEFVVFIMTSRRISPHSWRLNIFNLHRNVTKFIANLHTYGTFLTASSIIVIILHIVKTKFPLSHSHTTSFHRICVMNRERVRQEKRKRRRRN
jgi:hypothetical protein